MIPVWLWWVVGCLGSAVALSCAFTLGRVRGWREAERVYESMFDSYFRPAKPDDTEDRSC